MTEIHQPINPMRVWQKGSKHRFCHPVFAIAISNNEHVEYITINGMYIKQEHIMFAEMLINGVWSKLYTIETTDE